MNLIGFTSQTLKEQKNYKDVFLYATCYKLKKSTIIFYTFVYFHKKT